VITRLFFGILFFFALRLIPEEILSFVFFISLFKTLYDSFFGVFPSYLYT